MEQYSAHIDENAVRAKAHELWVQRGCPQNSAEDDWYQAERLLRAEKKQPPMAAQQPRPYTEAAETDDLPPPPKITRRRY